jgi:hypothetical protein
MTPTQSRPCARPRHLRRRIGSRQVVAQAVSVERPDPRQLALHARVPGAGVLLGASGPRAPGPGAEQIYGTRAAGPGRASVANHTAANSRCPLSLCSEDGELGQDVLDKLAGHPTAGARVDANASNDGRSGWEREVGHEPGR